MEPTPNMITVGTNQTPQASAFQPNPINYGTNCRQLRPNAEPSPNMITVSTNQTPQASAFQPVPFNYRMYPVSEVPFNRPGISYRAANNSTSSNYCPPVVSIPRQQQIEPRKSCETPFQEVEIGALTKTRRRTKRSRRSRKGHTISVSHRQLSPTAGKNGHNKLEPIFPIDLNRLLESQRPDNSAITPAVPSSDSNRTKLSADKERTRVQKLVSLKEFENKISPDFKREKCSNISGIPSEVGNSYEIHETLFKFLYTELVSPVEKKAVTQLCLRKSVSLEEIDKEMAFGSNLEDLLLSLKNKSPKLETLTEDIKLLGNELEAAAIDYENYDLIESIALSEESLESILSATENVRPFRPLL